MRMVASAILIGSYSAALAAVSASSTGQPVPPPRVVLTFLVDDLGFWDSSVYNARSVTPVLRSLADDGVRLSRMYTYKYCSPTRRSLLSGRFPVHLSGAQAPVCSDYLPLNMTLLSRKLQAAGVESHFIGKGHLGYVTMDHLPVNRGFSSHVGYLYGAENYSHGDSHMNRYWTTDFWHDRHPGSDVVQQVFYSTNYYTSRAVGLIQNFSQQYWRRQQQVVDDRDLANASRSNGLQEDLVAKTAGTKESLWIHLAHQAVHSPIIDVPQWERTDQPQSFWDGVYADMLHVLDTSAENVTTTLKAEQMWSETLMIVQSDNGGVGTQGNNHPLRGSKMTPWEGGTRLRLTNPLVEDLIDRPWNGCAAKDPTLCEIFSLDPRDDALLDGTLYPIDGINIWNVIANSSANDIGEGIHTDPGDRVKAQAAAAVVPGREWLPITEDSLLWHSPTHNTTFKLITRAQATQWYEENGTQVPDDRSEWPCGGQPPISYPPDSRTLDDLSEGSTSIQCFVCTGSNPCLFDLIADPGERTNLARDNPAVVSVMRTKLAAFTAYVHGDMSAHDLQAYECWGNWTGPCMKGGKSLACNPKWVVNGVVFAGPCCARRGQV